VGADRVDHDPAEFAVVVTTESAHLDPRAPFVAPAVAAERLAGDLAREHLGAFSHRDGGDLDTGLGQGGGQVGGRLHTGRNETQRQRPAY